MSTGTTQLAIKLMGFAKSFEIQKTATYEFECTTKSVGLLKGEFKGWSLIAFIIS